MIGRYIYIYISVYIFCAILLYIIFLVATYLSVAVESFICTYFTRFNAPKSSYNTLRGVEGGGVIFVKINGESVS